MVVKTQKRPSFDSVTIEKKMKENVEKKDVILYERLKELRKEHSLEIDVVARFLGVSEHTYAGYEAKPNATMHRSPSLDKLVNLARFYNVSLDYLLGLDNKPAYAEK